MKIQYQNWGRAKRMLSPPVQKVGVCLPLQPVIDPIWSVCWRRSEWSRSGRGSHWRYLPYTDRTTSLTTAACGSHLPRPDAQTDAGSASEVVNIDSWAGILYSISYGYKLLFMRILTWSQNKRQINMTRPLFMKSETIVLSVIFMYFGQCSVPLWSYC